MDSYDPIAIKPLLCYILPERRFETTQLSQNETDLGFRNSLFVLGGLRNEARKRCKSVHTFYDFLQRALC